MKTDLKSGPGRHPHRRAMLVLPLPPSANNAWINVRGRGRARSVEHNSWRQAAGWQIKAARVGKIKGLVSIKIRAGVPTRRRDIDNVVKPIIDALATFGILEDDHLVHRVSAEWSAAIESGFVQVEILEFSSPETRQKISVVVAMRHAARRAAQPVEVAA